MMDQSQQNKNDAEYKTSNYIKHVRIINKKTSHQWNRSQRSESDRVEHSTKDGTMTADVSASSTSHHFKSSASLLLSGQKSVASTQQLATEAPVFGNEADFSSPDVRSIYREVGSEFAMLENALIDSTTTARSAASHKQLGLAARRKLSPMSINYPAIESSYQPESNSSSTATVTIPTKLNQAQQITTSNFTNSLSELSTRLDGKSNLHLKKHEDDDNQLTCPKKSSDRIQELLNRVQETSTDDRRQTPSDVNSIGGRKLETNSENLSDIQDENRKKFMCKSIERIDQRMSDLCKKLLELKDTKESIDLLKIMIQMIEKAWSVPVCGDDLGFKLCNSLREAGGLFVVLEFIHEAAEEMPAAEEGATPSQRSAIDCEIGKGESNSEVEAKSLPKQLKTNLNSTTQLKLDLDKVNRQQSDLNGDIEENCTSQGKQILTTKDNDDSDTLTSDLGLDSASIESLVCVPASRRTLTTSLEEKKTIELDKDQQQTETKEIITNEKKETNHEAETTDLDVAAEENDDDSDLGKEDEAKLEKEELTFLSARLLSQCLTSDNRDYIATNFLDSVIKLACNFSTTKSDRIIHQLASRSMLVRQSSSVSKQQQASNSELPETRKEKQNEASKSCTVVERTTSKTKHSSIEHNDLRAIIGTEILQHLFKHSEETCQKMISLDGLQAILYGCRSSNIEILRHCASALANLALYGGPDGQQTMIEQKAHVWLFPLAFHEDDNVQYYACLAIVVLAANKEIEADVIKSSTLDLVEPFVLSHEPQKFAKSTTSHIHGQSANWLRKLVPLLESKREEARNLASFHFAMEAFIKREQNQTEVFKEIGAVEPLRKVGSSPQAIGSRFACRALRLIGEKEPHKLSQQVPLWTSEDVVEWVSQIGFERFRQVFIESRVDGDLLLQLDEEMLKSDIGLENGIIRRRFLRELSNLKRIADYSSVDKSGLCSMLCSKSQEFVQYIYPLLQLGVTKDSIHLFECEQLLRECKITNTIHQIKLAQTLKEIQERTAIEAATQECNSLNGADQKTLDVFVSYRRSTGSQLASLLKVHLQLRGFSVFIDVERLEAGKFDHNLLDSVKAAKNFIIVLSPNALDRCIDDHECKDWVHKEIVAALASNCNIIPIIDNFHWPDPEQLPEDMRSIIYFNGVRWIHDYQDACVDKVERFIRGELNNQGQFSAGSQVSTSSAQSSLQRLPGQNGTACSISTPSINATPSQVGLHSFGYQYSRPPFDAEHHPLSFASQLLQEHSQSSQVSAIRR